MATSYAALLRGINVGGNRKIHMADLRDLFAEAGCGDVASYIQSGNVVFTHDAGEAELTAELERRITDATGFEVPVMLRELFEHVQQRASRRCRDRCAAVVGVRAA